MWKECREMAVRRIRWRSACTPGATRCARLAGRERVVPVDSWTHVMLGQGITPGQHHPLSRGLSDAGLCRRLLPAIRKPIDEAVARNAFATGFIDRYCKAAPEVWAARRPTIAA
jgi:tryptophan halogenase